jgi:hypothetical protein
VGKARLASVTKDLDAELRKASRDPHGWWVKAVLTAFHFLETDFAYRLEEVRLHFRGDYISYDGSVYQLSLGYDSEESGDCTAHLIVLADMTARARPRWLSIPLLLEAVAPGQDWGRARSIGPLTNVQVQTLLELWASGLQAHAPNILRGAWADVPGWEYMW